MHTTTAAIPDQRRRISRVLENRCELSDVLAYPQVIPIRTNSDASYTGLTRASIALRIGSYASPAPSDSLAEVWQVRSRRSVLGRRLRADRVNPIYWDGTGVWFLCQAA